MNFEEIKDLIKVIDASNLSEFHIEQENIKLTIKKEIIIQQSGTIDRTEYITREPKVHNTTALVEPKEVENYHIIKSPIVGIFYSAANPEAPDFVKVGDKIKQGQVLCIVEAMKLMNEITSDIDGEIMEILGKPQSPVEFGQTLFKVRKA